MLRSKFIGTVLVIILGVNIGAWTLSVATTSSPSSLSTTSLSVPVSPAAIDAQSQAASVELTQSPVIDAASIDTENSATPIATSTQD
jgi:hypothetical protein